MKEIETKKIEYSKGAFEMNKTITFMTELDKSKINSDSKNNKNTEKSGNLCLSEESKG